MTAARLVAETANASRFRIEAAWARHAGVAPIPDASGSNPGRVRLNRSGNRLLNAAIHRIALTQIRCGAAGAIYYQNRIAAGDSRSKALRRLKRRLARVVFQRLRADSNRDDLNQAAGALATQATG